MGTVHVARDLMLGRKVAYKRIGASLLGGPERFAERFVSEAQLTA